MIRSRRGETFPIFDDQDLLFFLLVAGGGEIPRAFIANRALHPTFLRGRVVRQFIHHADFVDPFTADRVWPHVSILNRALHPTMLEGRAIRRRMITREIFPPPTICKAARYTPQIDKPARYTPQVDKAARYTPQINKKGQFNEC